MIRAQVVVTGRVQGVCFRAETQRRARSLGVTGWVRNRSDGAVEAVFEGDEERVESMVRWCGRGPSDARVDELHVERGQARGERGFDVA
jgi:acylphosphatase